MPGARQSSTIPLVERLAAICGKRHVQTGREATRAYRTGFRFGEGSAAAVVRPGSLVEQWRVLIACVQANCIVVMQAANTGLTGGSTPDGDGYDRPVVIVSTLRLDKFHLLDGGRQVICLPGASLHQLERALAPLGREPHSVIGSSCLGASVIGGVCNNSGGALVRRGPAFSEMALFAQRAGDGTLALVNHLGLTLGNDPEAMLGRLDTGAFDEDPPRGDGTRRASDADYAAHVRDIDAATPARHNADPRRLFETAGCAGKVAVFAVRLDTFATPAATRMFYIGTNDPAALTRIRRDMLGSAMPLPVSAEYIHRTAFDIAAGYGKDTVLAIRLLGTARLPLLFAAKARIDRLARRLRFLPRNLSDRMLQSLAEICPRHLPARMRDFRDHFEHHLLLVMSDEGIDDARAYLAARAGPAVTDSFECTPDEARSAALHRFAVAGAAVRYRAIHHREVEDIVAIDVALRRNDRDWIEVLPEPIAANITHCLYYGHFFCHVFHQDYIIAKGADPAELVQDIHQLMDRRGARYPAEHGFGHHYHAPPEVLDHFRALDPTNSFNPGIGHASRTLHWQ